MNRFQNNRTTKTCCWNSSLLKDVSQPPTPGNSHGLMNLNALLCGARWKFLLGFFPCVFWDPRASSGVWSWLEISWQVSRLPEWLKLHLRQQSPGKNSDEMFDSDRKSDVRLPYVPIFWLRRLILLVDVFSFWRRDKDSKAWARAAVVWHTLPQSWLQFDLARWNNGA